MTSLADVRKGDVFLVGVRCSAADQVAGLTVGLFGPRRDKMADGQITPAGLISGQLVTTPDQVPVQLVTGFAPLGVGDVLQDGAGETMVVQWTQISPDGSVVWSSSAAHRVVYPAAGWAVVGHVDL